MNTDMLYYQKVFIKRCLEEDCYKKWNGEELVFNKVEDGPIMKSTNQSLLFYFSEELWVQMLEQDFHQRTGLLQKSDFKNGLFIN